MNTSMWFEKKVLFENVADNITYDISAIYITLHKFALFIIHIYIYVVYLFLYRFRLATDFI